MNPQLTNPTISTLIRARVTYSVAAVAMLCWSVLQTASAQLNTVEVAPADLVASHGFGDSAAASGNIFAVGSRHDDTKGIDAGAVDVFNATTGARLRKLYAPAADASASDEFGASLAAAGTILAVGAPGEVSTGTGQGAVYLYNLITGAHIKTLRAKDGSAGDRFGHALAIDGDLLVIGAPNKANATAVDVGAIYIYNLRSGAFTTENAIQFTTQEGANFGWSVTVSGTLIAVGAPNDLNGSLVKTGAVFRVDGDTGLAIDHFTPSSSQKDDQFGFSVALGHDELFVGAPGYNGGKGQVFRTRMNFISLGNFTSGSDANEHVGWSLATGAQFIVVGCPQQMTWMSPVKPVGGIQIYSYVSFLVGDIQLSGAIEDDQFGTAVAVSGSTVIATAPGRDSRALDAGSAFIFSPIRQADVSFEVTHRNTMAPGAVETVFNTFDQLAVSPMGWTTFLGTVIGSGAAGGKNSGIWTNGNPTPFNTLMNIRRTGMELMAPRNGKTFSNPVSNRDGMVAFTAITTGTGINAANDAVCALWDGTILSVPLKEGDTVGSGPLATFQTPRMNIFDTFLMATSYTNKQGGQVSAINDSGIVTFDASGVKTTITENSASPIGTVNYGQFLPRVAYHSFGMFFASYLQTTTSVDNMAIFDGETFSTNLVARKNGPASDTNGESIGTFTNFLGEAAAPSVAAFHASIKPPTGSPANQNEGIWTTLGSPPKLALLKGRNYPALGPGVSIKTFLRFGFDSDSNLLLWVQLQGPGVTAANDGAILFSANPSLEPNTLEVFLREGYPAPGCSRARVGAIQNFDLDYQGTYVILASLVVETGGATAADNQALFLGRTVTPSQAPTALRKPQVAMRKGMRIERNGSEIVKSISLPGYITDATGALGSGLAHVVHFGAFSTPTCSAVITFEDGQTVVTKVFPST